MRGQNVNLIPVTHCLSEMGPVKYECERSGLDRRDGISTVMILPKFILVEEPLCAYPLQA